MDKKTKKRLQTLNQRVAKLRQQLAGSPGSVRLHRQLAEFYEAIGKREQAMGLPGRFGDCELVVGNARNRPTASTSCIAWL